MIQNDMNKNSGRNNMLMPTVITGVIALILFMISYHKGQQAEAIKITSHMAIEVLPIIFFAFVIAGIVQVLVPRELVAQWIGEASGLRGIFIGSVVGAFAPGGPYVSMPIAAGLIRSGASIGTIVAFMTGWSLWAVWRLPLEFGILGWRFMVIRLLSVLIFPPLAGLAAQFVSKFIVR